MPRGPLPSPERSRRNAPTIPTTALPASGRKGTAPKPPDHFKLGPAGLAWWRWAWKLPHALAWTDGDLYVLARRASLEDDLATVDAVETADVAALVGELPPEIRRIITGLASLATGRVTLMKEMDQLDDRLGLNAKAFAALRWTIVDDASSGPGQAGNQSGPASKSTAKKQANRKAAAMNVLQFKAKEA